MFAPSAANGLAGSVVPLVDRMGEPPIPIGEAEIVEAYVVADGHAIELVFDVPEEWSAFLPGDLIDA